MSSIPEPCTPARDLPELPEAVSETPGPEPLVCEDVDRSLGLPEGTAERLTPQQLGLVQEQLRTIVGPSGRPYALGDQAAIADELRGLGYDGSAPLTPELLDLGHDYLGFQGLYNDDRVQAYLGVQGLAMSVRPEEGFLNWTVDVPGEEPGGGAMDLIRDQAVNWAIRLVAGDASRLPVAIGRLLLNMGNNSVLERWDRILRTPLENRSADDTAFDQAQRRAFAQAFVREMPPAQRDLVALGERQLGLLEDQRLTMADRIRDELAGIGAGRGRPPNPRLSAE